MTGVTVTLSISIKILLGASHTDAVPTKFRLSNLCVEAGG